MIPLTPAQHDSLARIHARGPLVWDTNSKFLVTPPEGHSIPEGLPLEALEAAVSPTFGMDGCVMLPWQGMWLGIEADGYTHS